MNERQRIKANRRTVNRLVVVALMMFGFGYALVPLYDAFCEITGLNGKTGRVAVTTQTVPSARWVAVEFVASLDAQLPWEFRPTETSMQVHPGEFVDASYFARNTTSRTTTGQAVPSVAPARASRYFSKAECFCFRQQTLGPGEGREMPIKFMVDPKLPAGITTLTLSYTFFASGVTGNVALSQR